ncbi:MAG: aldehyde dehydrogenase (NAD+) [Halieaceae bacterium]|jgi:aldehyde dehydrogenase (NAD+)
MSSDAVARSYPEVEKVFDIQQHSKWVQKKTGAEQRIALLLRLKEAITTHSPAILDALYKDLRKGPAQPTSAEHMGVLMDIDDCVANLHSWMSDEEVPASPHFAGSRSFIRSESRGACLLFGPWNFPFGLVFQPLVAMIAAGNTVIVKPNEMAPEVSKLSAMIIKEVFDDSLVSVFEGGVPLSEALLRLPFDHIFFTGSPAVGRVVMQAAAQHLTSVTLELGGKNPVVIDRNANLEKAAGIIGAGRGENAGQVCLCPEYVWVPNDLKDQFISDTCAAIDTTFYVDGQIDKERLSTIIDERNLTRVSRYLTDAIERGATVHCGGDTEADRTVHPAVLSDVPFDAVIMQEENFAPFLVVFGYDNIEEALNHIRAQGKPLALYVFSDDQAFVDDVLSSTSSGGVTVNNWLMHCAESNLPFGGVNDSGTGSYHGVHGFKELSHQRAVFVDQSV